MKLQTSNGYTYDIDWIDTVITGELYMQMQNTQRLPDIAAAFDGLEWMERVDANQGDKLFDGYSELTMVKRVAPDVVIMTFKKGDEANGNAN